MQQKQQFKLQNSTKKTIWWLGDLLKLYLWVKGKMSHSGVCIKLNGQQILYKYKAY